MMTILQQDRDALRFDCLQGLCRQIAKWGALIACGVGLLGVISWGLNLPKLSSWGADYVPMSPYAATAFLFSGMALWLHISLPSHRVARYGVLFSSGVVVLICGLSLVVILTHRELRIYEPPASFADPLILCMSRVSAVSLLLIAIGTFLLAGFPKCRLVALAPVLGCLVLAAAGLSLLGYVYGTPQLFGGFVRPVALPAAAGFFCLAFGLIAAGGPQRVPLRFICGHSIQARMLRLFIPIVFAVVLLSEILSDHFRRNATINLAFQAALQTVIAALVVSFVVMYLAKRLGGALDQVDATQREAEAKLRKAHDQLDRRVAERTAELAVVNEDLRREIAERRKTQAVLQESEQRFRKLFESTAAGIVVFAPTGRILQANRAYGALVGYAEDQLSSLEVGSLTHPDDAVQERRLFAELCQRKRDRFQLELRYMRKTSGFIWAHATASALLDEVGELLYVIVIIEDISQRIQADAVTRRLAAIVESSEDAILSVNNEGIITTWNKGAERLYGYAAEEALGQDVAMTVPPDRHGEVMRMRGELRSGKPIEHFETVRLRKDGTQLEVAVSLSPLHNLAGAVIGFSGIIRDISVRKRLERELLEISASERCRIGHDLHDGLGQYLAGIALKAKTLEGLLEEDNSSQVERVKEVVGLVNNAIRQTRLLAHGLSPIQVEANGLVAALHALAAQIREWRQVECRFACESEGLDVQPETALALYRIAQEAIHNAVTHGKAQGVELNLEVAQRQLRLRIQDNGGGMVPKPPSETGMGLHIMRYRASSIGAEFNLQAEPQRGVCIECCVPQQRWQMESGVPQ